MSIHIDIKPEAKARLAREKRASTITSIAISVLLIALIMLSLGLFLLPNLFKESPTILTYKSQVIKEEEQNQKKVNTNVQRKPSAPSSTQVRVIASTAVSEISIPVPDVTMATPTVEFGDGDDFGTGWGEGAGNGGGGGMFGSNNSIPGALKGRLFDFKQDRSGKDIKYNPDSKNYAGITKRMESRRFSFSAFTDYFEAPNELNLTHLAIPFTPADKGPEYFGAKKTIKPSGWMAAYHGRIAAPATGRYRFRAAADDVLVLLIDSRRNLVACWPSIQSDIAGSWKSTPQQGSTQSPLGDAQLHAGDWMSLTGGRPFDITLAVGERPGGMVGFVLEVEKEGETYRTAKNGRKILPLFTTHAFTDAEKQEIKSKFGGYEFEWNKVPVFGIK